MKTSKKRAPSHHKRRSNTDEVDIQLEQADFSNAGLKQAVGMEKVHEARVGRGRPSVGKRRSIILPDELIERLKTLADKLNVGGYQPLIRLILSEKLSEYEKRAKSNDCRMVLPAAVFSVQRWNRRAATPPPSDAAMRRLNTD